MVFMLIDIPMLKKSTIFLTFLGIRFHHLDIFFEVWRKINATVSKQFLLADQFWHD